MTGEKLLEWKYCFKVYVHTEKPVKGRTEMCNQRHPDASIPKEDAKHCDPKMPDAQVFSDETVWQPLLQIVKLWTVGFSP